MGIIGTPEFSKNEDLGLFGAFNDNVFYNIIDEEDEDDDNAEHAGIDNESSSEAEDFDFLWMREYAQVFLPKFEDYYEKEETRFNRQDLRNFFPDCDGEQIDDIFEYFEDENGYDTNDGTDSEWINVLQIIALLQQSDKEPGHMGEDGDVHKKKKAVRVGVSIADQLKDELAQFQTSSDDDDDDDVAVQKKKRKHSNKSAQKSTAAMFAAIDDFDTSSDNDGDVNGGGFFTSDKKTDIKYFGLSDDDSDDDFGLMDELNSKITKQASAENEIDPTKLLPNKQKKAQKKKNNDPFGDSSDNENDAETDLFSSNTKTAKKQSNDPFGDSSDDDDFGNAQNIKSQIDPTKLLPNKQQKKAVSNDMFGSSDDDEFESKPIATKKIKKNVQKTKIDMFDDSDDDDMFGSVKENESKKKGAAKKSVGFDFDDSDDDPLFASMSKPNKVKETKASKPKSSKRDNMFGDSSDDDDPLSNLINSQKQTPKADKGEMSKSGIKIDVNKLKMGMGAPLTVNKLKAAKAGKSVPKKTSFSASDHSENALVEKEEHKKKKAVDPLGGMFGDSDDDEDFDVAPKNKKIIKKVVKNDMFDDSDDDEDDVFGSKTIKTKISTKQKEKKLDDPLGGMFGDSDDDEIVSTKANVAKITEPKEDKGEMSKVGIKIDVNKLRMGMGAGLTVSQIKAQKAVKKKVSEQQSKKVNMKKHPFGDDSDDGDDILIAPKKTKESKQEKKESKPSILDDPLLSVPSLTVNKKEEPVKKDEVQK